jgi:integrase
LYASGGHKRTIILHVSCTNRGGHRCPSVRSARSARFHQSAGRLSTPPDTKLHYAPSTFEAKIDAEGWLTDERRLIASGKWVAPAIRRQHKSITVAEYASPWLTDRNLKPRTKQLYRSLLDQRILPTLGDKSLAALTAADIRGWHAEQDKATPTARAHAYALLRTILGSAVDDELITINPCRIRGASQTKRRHRIEPATLEQLQTIIDKMPPRYRLMILLAAWRSFRFSELTELRRGDIDLSNGKIKISRAVTWVKGKPIIGSPKSDAGIRDAAIPPHLILAVRQHLQDHVLWGKDALLFTTVSGGQIARGGAFQKHWERARKAARRPDLRFHDLRHTAGTMAAQAGATLAELMGLLGDSTPAMAIRYQHIVEGRDAELARRMSVLAEANR